MIKFLRKMIPWVFRNAHESMSCGIVNRFVLGIEDADSGFLEIGYLEFANGMWTFEYSNAFRKQDKYVRLIGFSDLNKTYKSDILWPFFKIRIPGLKQPLVQEIIQAENIDQKDEASLLKRFGRKNISNPYLLEPA